MPGATGQSTALIIIIIIIIIIITMYINKHNRRSHIITTFSENIYFMILQPINCIKSLILNSTVEP